MNNEEGPTKKDLKPLQAEILDSFYLNVQYLAQVTEQFKTNKEKVKKTNFEINVLKKEE